MHLQHPALSLPKGGGETTLVRTRPPSRKHDDRERKHKTGIIPIIVFTRVNVPPLMGIVTAIVTGMYLSWLTIDPRYHVAINVRRNHRMTQESVLS